MACYTYGERRYAYRALVGNLIDRGCLEGLGVDGMMILKCIFKTSVEKERNGLIWFRIVVDEGML